MVVELPYNSAGSSCGALASARTSAVEVENASEGSLTISRPGNLLGELKQLGKNPAFWIISIVAIVTTVLGFTPLSQSNQWLSGFGVLAFWIATFGIIIAVMQVSRSQRSIEAAEDATRTAIQNQSRYAVTVDTLVISERIRQIRQLQHSGEWIRAHERYPAIRKGLSDIAEQLNTVAIEDRKVFREGTQKLAVLEEKIGDALSAGLVPDLTDSNLRLLRDIELKVQEVSSKLSASRGITHA